MDEAVDNYGQYPGVVAAHKDARLFRRKHLVDLATTISSTPLYIKAVLQQLSPQICQIDFDETFCEKACTKINDVDLGHYQVDMVVKQTKRISDEGIAGIEGFSSYTKTSV